LRKPPEALVPVSLMGVGIAAFGGGAYLAWGPGIALVLIGAVLIVLALLIGWR
jgi:hypothetical protein